MGLFIDNQSWIQVWIVNVTISKLSAIIHTNSFVSNQGLSVDILQLIDVEKSLFNKKK